MSVYTNINLSDAEALLSDLQSFCHHDLGVIQSIEAIGEGFSNSVFAWQTTTGRYVLKIMEHPIDSMAPISVEQQHLIQLVCYAQGLLVPQPLGPLFEVKGKKAQLMRHVDGVNLTEITLLQARTLGARTAEFQIGLQAIRGFCPRCRVKPAKLLIGELIASIGRLRTPTDSGEITYLVSTIDLAKAFLRTRRDLELKRVPKGITHADINKGNVMFTRDGSDVAAFLDFESLSPGFLIRDLVKLIYEFAIIRDDSGRFHVDRELTLALIEGYSSSRPLLKVELESVEAVLDMTSRWQAASHQKLHLVGRHHEDTTTINMKASTIRSSQHSITNWLKEVRLL